MNHPTRTLQVQSYDHITLVVSDLEATTKFYVNVLGMSEASRPAFNFPGAWYQLGATQIHATVESDLAGLAGWADRNALSVSRGHHFAFVVKDFDATLAVIRDLNIKIADGPKFRPDGARQVYIWDPDGHLIELCT